MVKKLNLSDSNYKTPQNPPYRVWQPNQLCQMAVRGKLHNFLAFIAQQDAQKRTGQRCF